MLQRHFLHPVYVFLSRFFDAPSPELCPLGVIAVFRVALPAASVQDLLETSVAWPHIEVTDRTSRSTR